MLDPAISRHGPLDALAGTISAAGAVELSIVGPATRYVLRCWADPATAVAQGFGTALPDTCRASVAGERAALWLGPDEWLLIAPEDDSFTNELSAALFGIPHALVDVSHRTAAMLVNGPYAALLINHGCPLDLSAAAFPVGMCTRTVFEKAEVILWRIETQTFRIEVERSFAPYVCGLLAEIREELG
jgi:sarcosine oxidase subunit gamma